MDSLNMNNLVSSLPSSTIVKAEQDTMDKFRAAAQSLTLLYRSSQKASRRHFDAGYAAALEDILSVIQHGVSAGPDPNASENGGNEAMSIGRILDWIEARQEGIRLKAREEEEEDEERDAKTRVSSTAKPSIGTSGSSNGRDKVTRKANQNISSSPTIPTSRLSGRQTSDRLMSSSATAPETSPSPTLPPASVTHSSTASQSSSSRPQTRARARSQHVLAPLNATSVNSSNATPGSGSSIASILGAKRRHAAMLLDSCVPTQVSVSLPSSELRGSPILSDSAPQPADDFSFAGGVALPPSSGPRRRLRSSRAGIFPRSENSALADGHTITGGDVMMDIEDDSGRERKRVARR